MQLICHDSVFDYSGQEVSTRLAYHTLKHTLLCDKVHKNVQNTCSNTFDGD